MRARLSRASPVLVDKVGQVRPLELPAAGLPAAAVVPLRVEQAHPVLPVACDPADGVELRLRLEVGQVGAVIL